MVALDVNRPLRAETEALVAGRVEKWLQAAAWRVRWRSQVRASLPLAPDERVLVMTPDGGGCPVAATDRALYHDHQPGRGGRPADWVRLGWEDVVGVDWDAASKALSLQLAGPAGGSNARLTVPRGATLAELASERVAWTTVTRSRVGLDGYREAVVVIRRRPGDERLSWHVLVPSDTDPEDPHVAASVERAVVTLRDTLGL